jgi:thiol:disulfide interchange protein
MNMRIFYSTLFLLLSPFLVAAQDNVTANKVVDWQFTAAPASGDQYIVSITGKIAEGWKLFSVTMKDDEPNTRVALDTNSRHAQLTALKEVNTVKEAKEPLLDNALIRYAEDEVQFRLTLVIKEKKPVSGKVTYMAIKGEEVAGPEEVPFLFNFDESGNLVQGKAGLQESSEAAGSLIRSAIDIKNPVKDCGGTGTENSESKSLWTIFLLGVAGGFLALIMPCTFPMIPLTVSYFTKKSSNRRKGIFNASLYGFFILLIYVLLSLPFYFLDAGSSDILNNISTNAWLNVFFAIVFLLFALSFFGYFELNLPGSITNTVDARSDARTVGGIFFMALTLCIVSFSCTGPILGSLIVGSLNQNGSAVPLTVAMAGFGLALGLPFALFAMFPNWLNSLPKSGGWMNTVKIVFGFLELAFAIKFISNADLVMHWGLLKREVFLGIWVLIGIALVLYLFGILKFKHDPPPPKLGKWRIGFALIFLAITIYLVPGLTKTKYANLSLISGMPPPLSYSLYGKELVEIAGVEADIVNDYEKALELAKSLNKPVLIDFTGWACVNCRRMEENVWPDKEVKELIEKEFILVSLYVDDRNLLPENQRFIFTDSSGNKKPIKTVGDKFFTLQDQNFQTASQPYYVIISPDEKLLNNPVAYMPDADEYAAWLKCGLDAHKNTAKK